MPTETVDHDDVNTPVERLEVKDSVQRKLFMLSGNECAWPDCRQVLVPSEGGWFGHIAHIRAAKAGGPRFDQTMTNNQRRDFDNLLLLCAKHHRLIDDGETAHRYSREDLEEIKRRHEGRFARALDDLGRAEEQYVDHTASITAVHCSTLRAVYGDDFFSEDELLTEVARFNRVADHLATATRAARQLLCLVVESDSRIGLAEAARRSRLARGEVVDLVDELRRLHLAEFDPTPADELEPGQVRGRIATLDRAYTNPIFDGLPFWEHLRTLGPDIFKKLIIDLDFSVLDSTPAEAAERPGPDGDRAAAAPEEGR
ncbi:HNH endonuclease [Streptomyces lavendulocolor]|uniref:HNH endonuclease n=1 Tax=Streptomyces lavendulocolor TaxID=67316 RepID=UPI003C2D3172